MPHKKKKRPPFAVGDLVLINYRPADKHNRVGIVSCVLDWKDDPATAPYGTVDIAGHSSGFFGKAELTHIQ